MKHTLNNPGPVAVSAFCAWLDAGGYWADYTNDSLHKVDTVSGHSFTNASRQVKRAVLADALIQAYGATSGVGVAVLKTKWGYAAFGVNFHGYPAPRGRKSNLFSWVRIPNGDALKMIMNQPWLHRHYEEGNAYLRYPKRTVLGKGPWVRDWKGGSPVRLVVERCSTGNVRAYWEAKGCAERRGLDLWQFQEELSKHDTEAEDAGLFGLPRKASEALIVQKVSERLASVLR